MVDSKFPAASEWEIITGCVETDFVPFPWFINLYLFLFSSSFMVRVQGKLQTYEQVKGTDSHWENIEKKKTMT